MKERNQDEDKGRGCGDGLDCDTVKISLQWKTRRPFQEWLKGFMSAKEGCTKSNGVSHKREARALIGDGCGGLTLGAGKVTLH